MTDTPILDSRDLAAYIAQQCDAEGIRYDNTRIQRLLYCVYGCMLAWKGTRACDEYPRAWTYGPVFPKVFGWICSGRDIADYSTRMQNGAGHDALKYAVQKVVNFFGRFTGSELAGWSHREGSPWWKVVKEGEAGWNSSMPDEYIREYFLEHVLAKS